MPIFLLQKNYFIRQLIDTYCREAGYSLKPIVELSDNESLLQITILNKGIYIHPKSYVAYSTNSQVVQIPNIDLIPKKEVGIIYRKDKPLDTVMETFIEHLILQYKR